MFICLLYPIIFSISTLSFYLFLIFLYIFCIQYVSLFSLSISLNALFNNFLCFFCAFLPVSVTSSIYSVYLSLLYLSIYPPTSPLPCVHYCTVSVTVPVFIPSLILYMGIIYLFSLLLSVPIYYNIFV